LKALTYTLLPLALTATPVAALIPRPLPQVSVSWAIRQPAGPGSCVRAPVAGSRAKVETPLEWAA